MSLAPCGLQARVARASRHESRATRRKVSDASRMDSLLMARAMIPIIIHRRGIFMVDGRPVISRLYAIDRKQIKDGVSFSGDPLDKGSYYAYGKTVLAVADSRGVTSRDGLPDNIPRHNQGFHPAAPSRSTQSPATPSRIAPSSANDVATIYIA